MSAKQSAAAADLLSPIPVNDNAGPPPVGALTIAGFCRLFNVGRSHVYAELKAGRLTARKTGSRTIILRSDALRWANSLPVLGAAR